MNRCPECDGKMQFGPVTLQGEYRGETFPVEMNGLSCAQCGYATVRGQDMAEFGRRRADAYRARHHLLTSDEIRKSRERLDMSQAAFAGYLRVGLASVKRWELGQVQDPAMDELIRLKTDTGSARDNFMTILTLAGEAFSPIASSQRGDHNVVIHAAKFEGVSFSGGLPEFDVWTGSIDLDAATLITDVRVDVKPADPQVKKAAEELFKDVA